MPDEARERIVAAATDDAPLDAGPAAILHVRFGVGRIGARGLGDGAGQDAAARPPRCHARGDPRPGERGGGGPPHGLRRGVAYDAELLAEVHRRLGDGLVELRLGQA